MREEALALDTVRVCEMTRHFEQRLRERLGVELTLERVNQLLSEAKRIRRQTVYYKLINCEFRRRVLIGEWWHHEAGIIMLIDEWKSKAVTIVTPNDRLPICTRRPYDEKMRRR
jgi:hypothetical protein